MEKQNNDPKGGVTCGFNAMIKPKGFLKYETGEEIRGTSTSWLTGH